MHAQCCPHLWSWTGIQLLPHAEQLCDHSLIFQVIHRTLFAYCAEVAAPDTPSNNNKNQLTECCSSLVQTENGAAMINGKAAMMELI
jgi:hypothetical protein